MKLLRFKKHIFNWWPVGLIFLIVLVFFWKFWFKNLLPVPADTIVGMYHPWRDLYAGEYPQGIPFKNFLITDSVRQQIPWRWLAIESFKSGSLPLWNPYCLTGTPLLANFQSGAFYFLNALFFILDSKLAWGILILLQPLLAGIFLFLYLRQLKLSTSAGLIGSLVLAFSGFFIAWLEWGTVLHSALWLPLILLAIEKIIELRIPRSFGDSFGMTNYGLRVKKYFWSGVFVFSLAQSFFAGHLQTFFYVFIFSFIYLLWKLWLLKNQKGKIFFLFSILYSLFFILTYIQWKPTFDFVRLSARGIDQANWQEPGWFIPWQHLVQFLAPDFFGNPSTLNYWGTWNYGELISYIGVIPLFLALAVIFGNWSQKIKFFTLSGLLFLSFALPTPWAKLPYQGQIPLMATSQPTRLIFLVDFCLAVLAAFGFECLRRVRKKSWRWVGISLLSVYGLLWLIVLFNSGDNWLVARRNLIFPSAILVAGLILFWLRRFWFRLSLGLMFLLIIFDLLRFGWKFTPFTPAKWFFPKTEVINFLKNDQDTFRIMSIDRRIMPPNFATQYQLQDISGYDPLYLRHYAELVAAWQRGEPNISPPFGFNRIITPDNYNSRITDLLNVKYVLSLIDLDSPKLDLVFQEGETRVYRNKDVFPRAFLVYDYQVIQSKQEAIDLLFDPGVDLRKTVVLEEEIDFVVSARRTESRVKIISYQPNSIRLEVVSDQPAILVLTDAFYPGWKAEVDGFSVPILPADYHFRAIIVPAGSDQVFFNYGD